MKRLIIYVTVFFFMTLSVYAAETNPSLHHQDISYHLRASVDISGKQYISYGGIHPSVITYVNNDGSVSVCADNNGEKQTVVYEYNSSLNIIRTLQFTNELRDLGSFTKDDEGNYYFFYGEPARNNQKRQENMALVKYSPSGEKLKTFKLNASAANSFDGIRIPFDAGTCRLELSGSMLAVYFGREMFSGHQACFGFVVDKDSLERLDKASNTGYNEKSGGFMSMPYVSHSFNQFILPIQNGFIFADHGDAYPRCFTFASFQNNGSTKRLNAFRFAGAVGQNATYAEMGGLAKTSTGYIFIAAFGKDRNSSRDIIVLTFDDNLTKCSAPLSLTKYTRTTGHAAHPKIVGLEEGKYLVLWEVVEYSTQSANSITYDPTNHLSTNMLIIDETGKALSEVQQLPGVRLNMNDVLRYNKKDRKVYWAINDGQSIITYALDPYSEITVKPEDITVSERAE
ncbi:hypothetical protein AGMMS50293_23170 [Spirochaetia bacterium]|nr:hypothetical protein AGMMS50293_23170 [Spirochaetia bacterium]